MNWLNSSFSPGRWCVSCQEYIDPRLQLSAPSLCFRCHQNLPWYQRELCFFCGHVHLTGECNQDFGSEIQEYRAIFYYKEPISTWISALKYSRNLLRGRILKQLVNNWMIEHEEWLSEFDLLAPIPIHQARLWFRGFNQTSYLVRDQTFLPVAERVVRKVKKTRHQAALSGKHRFSNLKRSFQASTEVEGKSILLFDDVCTTGQTLDQVAYQLKKAGAERISAISVARTQSRF